MNHVLNPTFLNAQIKLRVSITNQVDCSDQRFLFKQLYTS